MMPGMRSTPLRPALRGLVCGIVCGAGLVGPVLAQPAPAQAVPPAGAQAPAQPATPPAAATAGARFLEACNEALERGVAELGCQGPIYRNELERLQREALATQNPQLLSFVGDAYRNPRAGIGDMGQAYRWYLLAAVRGDPRAMQRLAEMNRKGQGVPRDNVKALGYARLLERLAQPDTGTQRNVLSLINELGAEMAVEEVALAERFASELEARIQRQATADASGKPVDAPPAPAGAVRPGSGLPGMSAVPRSLQVPAAAAPAAPQPGSTLPGTPGKAPP